MWKYLLHVCVISCACLSLRAQDSAFVDGSVSIRLRSDSVKWQQYNFGRQSPFWLGTHMPARYSQVILDLNYEKGKLAPIQGSTKTRALTFSTEGTTQLKGIKLFGAFSHSRTYEDSTRWAHQSRNNPSVPVYYGAIAPVAYERMLYLFKAYGQKNLLRNNLPLSVGLDYRIGEHYGTNDPRGYIRDFQFDGIITAGWKFNAVTIGAGYRAGYGREDVAIGYKNKAYYESVAFPDYVNWEMNGYGQQEQSPMRRLYQNDFRRKGPEFYIHSKSAIGEISGTVKLIKEQQDIFQFLKISTGKSYLNEYSLDTRDIQLRWQKDTRKGRLAVDVTAFMQYGRDFNTALQGKNYLYDYSNYLVKLTHTRDKGEVLRNIFLSGRLVNELRQDGSYANKVGYDHLILTAGWGLNKFLKQRMSWGIDGYIGYQHTLSQQFIVKESEKYVFAPYVIYHDYLYNGTDRLLCNLSTAYRMPFLQYLQAAIKLSAGYERSIKEGTLPAGRIPLSIPGNDRLTGKLSIGLYF